MDKIKEVKLVLKQKLEKLRIEAEANLARAEKAEGEVKTLNDTLQKNEVSIQSLNNKISNLSVDLERSEKRAEEVRLYSQSSIKLQNSSLTRTVM